MADDPRSPPDDFPQRAGFLILRAFLGTFWILQFYFKLHDPDTGQLALSHLWSWSAHMVADFASSTPLPAWLVQPYTLIVPWVELAVGLLILAGVQTRWALVGAALLLVSLDQGLMLKGDHDTVKSNTILLFALLWALLWERHNRWTVDAILKRR